MANKIEYVVVNGDDISKSFVRKLSSTITRYRGALKDYVEKGQVDGPWKRAWLEGRIDGLEDAQDYLFQLELPEVPTEEEIKEELVGPPNKWPGS